MRRNRKESSQNQPNNKDSEKKIDGPSVRHMSPDRQLEILQAMFEFFVTKDFNVPPGEIDRKLGQLVGELQKKFEDLKITRNELKFLFHPIIVGMYDQVLVQPRDYPTMSTKD